jgi:hypothetical protein
MKRNPSNGAETTSTFEGTYSVSFYPNYNLYKWGIISVIFPPTEFSTASFKNNPLRCYVSGAISTFYSCTLLAGVPPTIQIVMDSTLLVQDGMQPVVVTIPRVTNFNS